MINEDMGKGLKRTKRLISHSKVLETHSLYRRTLTSIDAIQRRSRGRL